MRGERRLTLGSFHRTRRFGLTVVLDQTERYAVRWASHSRVGAERQQHR